MNWTSSFLVQSDKLVIVLHLLLAPVGRVVMPGEHEVVRHRSPTPVLSRCFPPSHGLKARVIPIFEQKLVVEAHRYNY